MHVSKRQKVECVSANRNDTINKPVIQGFYIYADNLGRSKVKASLIWVDKPQENSGLSAPGWMDVFDQAEEQNSKIHVSTQINEYPRWLITDARIFVNKQRLLFDENSKLRRNLSRKYNKTIEGRWENQIQVTIILRPQKFYLASDWSAAIIAFMISLSVGCCNDPVMLRLHIKRPRELLAGIFCQLLTIPGLALLVGICFQLDVDQAFGLFLTATVPGGGLAYLLTYLVHGDRHLSASLSFIVSWIDIAVSPIWTSTVGWFWFNRPLHTGKSVGWLSIIAFAQTLGMVMRGCRPGVAHAVLTWITRPLLLLSGILMGWLTGYLQRRKKNEQQNVISTILVSSGSVPPGDISVASVAAVAAAAIAVAPAITARPRGATAPTQQATTWSTEDTNSKQHHSATKVNYGSLDCMYASQTQPKSIVKENSFALDHITRTANETDNRHCDTFFHELKQSTARNIQREDRKSDYRQSRQATVTHSESDHAMQEIESIPECVMDFTGDAVLMRPIRHEGQAPCSSLDPELQTDETPAVITKMDRKSIIEKPRSMTVMKKRERQPPLPYTNL
ncbi:hypothetical protein AHF37_00142 [Paragonimus kellicotti]|nr:hypothetical protein AHF37_00142 [Paragonimus kellicotti]